MQKWTTTWREWQRGKRRPVGTNKNAGGGKGCRSTQQISTDRSCGEKGAEREMQAGRTERSCTKERLVGTTVQHRQIVRGRKVRKDRARRSDWSARTKTPAKEGAADRHNSSAQAGRAERKAREGRAEREGRGGWSAQTKTLADRGTADRHNRSARTDRPGRKARAGLAGKEGGWPARIKPLGEGGAADRHKRSARTDRPRRKARGERLGQVSWKGRGGRSARTKPPADGETWADWHGWIGAARRCSTQKDGVSTQKDNPDCLFFKEEGGMADD